MPLNENAKKWVAALRSGEFQQCGGALHSGNGYCCLGVACELYRREVCPEEQWIVKTGSNVRVFLGEMGCLPSEVMAWLGIASPYANYGRDDSLACANDRFKSFEEIADIIESEPDGLFATAESPEATPNA